MVAQVKCKVCEDVKARVKAEAKNKDKHGYSQGNRYRDLQGRAWNGNICPDCNVYRLSQKKKHTELREYRAKDRSKLTKRKCGRCNKALPKTHYFNCPECLSNMTDTFMPEDWGYNVLAF